MRKVDLTHVLMRTLLTVIHFQIVFSLFAQSDTIRYANGNVFMGDTISKKGTLFMPNGAICKGVIIRGRPNGVCTFYSQSGDKRGFKYYGEFKKGEFHGKGRLDRSGMVLVCTFVDGIEQGDGIIFYDDGRVYSGGVRKGEPHGYGKKYHKHSYVEGHYEKGRLKDGYIYNPLLEKPNRFRDERFWISTRQAHQLIENGKVLQYSYAYPRITDLERQQQYAALMSELKPFPGEKLTKAEIKFSKQISRQR